MKKYIDAQFSRLWKIGGVHRWNVAWPMSVAHKPSNRPAKLKIRTSNICGDSVEDSLFFYEASNFLVAVVLPICITLPVYVAALCIISALPGSEVSGRHRDFCLSCNRWYVGLTLLCKPCGTGHEVALSCESATCVSVSRHDVTLSTQRGVLERESTHAVIFRILRSAHIVAQCEACLREE